MKATDLEVGTEYVVCTGNPFDRIAWQSRKRVRIVEAPVVGWARRYSFGSTYARVGVLDTARDARRDHALVEVLGQETGDNLEVDDNRVRLRDIKGTWAAYEQWREQLKRLELAEKDKSTAQQAQVRDINRRLRSWGLEVTIAWSGKSSILRVRGTDTYQLDEALEGMEALAEGAL